MYLKIRLTGIVWLCLSLPASAFDCGKYPVAANETDPPWADYIFDGRVKAVRVINKDDEPAQTQVVFEVTKVYRGVKKKQVTVGTAPFGFGDSSGYPFLCGEAYHVNAVNKMWSAEYRELSGLYTDQCMGVKPLSPGALDANDIGGILLGYGDESGATRQEKDKLWNRLYCVPN